MESKLYEVSEYKKIVEDLLNGKVVGFPTETVYGLAIIYNDKSSFDKLYEIKNRSITKPISMMVSDRNVIEQVAYVNETQQKVIDNYIVDFYCHDARLIIELDGSQHYEDEGLKKDKIRTEKIEKRKKENICFEK